MRRKEKTKRQLQAEQTKDKLFYAASQLLAELDFDEITIRDIVAQAGVSIGTFYHYYDSKIDVFYETYRMADDYFRETIAPQTETQSAYDSVLLFFDFYAHYNAEKTDPKLLRLLYNPTNTFFNRDPHQGMQQVLLELVERGLENGEFFSGDSPEYIVRYLMICVRGLVYNWCTTGFVYDLQAETNRFVRRLLKAYTSH